MKAPRRITITTSGYKYGLDIAKALQLLEEWRRDPAL